LIACLIDAKRDPSVRRDPAGRDPAGRDPVGRGRGLAVEPPWWKPPDGKVIPCCSRHCRNEVLCAPDEPGELAVLGDVAPQPVTASIAVSATAPMVADLRDGWVIAAVKWIGLVIWLRPARRLLPAAAGR
jgi:hypothetical protein